MRSRIRTSGFTLIELLIVVVIVGILASIVLARHRSTTGRAAAAALKSDLHNLTTAQESYFSDAWRYTSDLTALRFVASPSVTIAVATVGSSGWSATATHPRADPGTCAIFYGAAAPPAPATIEGVVACQ